MLNVNSVILKPLVQNVLHQVLMQDGKMGQIVMIVVMNKLQNVLRPQLLNASKDGILMVNQLPHVQNV